LKRSVLALTFNRATLSLALLVGVASPCALSSPWQPSADAVSPSPGVSSTLTIKQLHHTALTAENGAPQFISSMAQDAQGFLWLVSNGSLYRYDGVKFDRTLGSRLPPGLLMTVYATPSGDLWLGYLLGGVARVHEGRITFYPFGKDIPSGTPFDFRQTPDGVLWVGCTNGLARFVNGAWHAASKEYGYDGRRLSQMVTTQDGSLWIGGADFAMVLRPGSHQFVELPLAEAEQEILRSPNVEWWHQGLHPGQRMRDASGAIWDGTSQGIRRYRELAAQDHDQPGVVDTYTTADGLSDDNVVGLYGDREGSIWVFTVTGLDQFRTSRATPVMFDKTIFKPAVAFDAQNTAWVGNLRGGYRIASGQKPEATPLMGTFVTLIAADPSGTVWFADNGGLHKIVGDKAISIPLPPHIAAEDFTNSYRAIAFGDGPVTWLSIAGAGVYALKNNAWQKDGALHGLPDDMALRMSFDHRGRLWILYSDGRIALVDHGAIRVYGKSDGLAIGIPTSISIGEDQIWVAGTTGIARFAEGRFIPLKLADSQLSEGFTGLVQRQNGDLWAHGNSGLIWITQAEINQAIDDPGYAVKAKVLGPEDGIVGLTDKIGPFPTLVPDHEGRLWVSTASSLAWIDPNHIPLNDIKPHPVIDALIVGDKSYPGDQLAELPMDTHNVRIVFTAASLRTPDEVQFEYKLDGVDPNWERSREGRQVNYMNLDHGQYLFHVRAVNEDGVAGDHEAVMRFTIAPAFYQRWWFQLLVAVLAVVLLWRLYVMRVNYLLGLFRAKVDERERIARELHDTLLQSAQGLLLLIESVSRAPADEDVRPRLRRVVSAARLTVVEGRKSVAMLRGDDQIDLVKELAEYANSLASDFGVPFYYTVEGHAFALNQGARHELLLALREAITNAFQHAKARHIAMHLRYEFWRLKASVVDDGVGIEKELLKEGGRSGHWGLSGMRERVEALGGRCRIVPAEGGGTVVQIAVSASRIYAAGMLRRIAERRLAPSR
jgi:ligand-binding sensor domain-containing protein/two-component sensor histidine kinase